MYMGEQRALNQYIFHAKVFHIQSTPYRIKPFIQVSLCTDLIVFYCLGLKETKIPNS